MKSNKLSLFCTLLVLVWVFSGCLKADSYMTTAAFDFVNAGTKYVMSDVTVNPKDSLYFQFNATSTTDMAKILVSKNGAVSDTFTVPDGSRNSFSGSKKGVADSVTGVYTYSFSAYDATGLILGTKSIVVSVNSDFNYFSNRNLFVPDTTNKTNLTYFSSTLGTLSYSNAGANTGAIDFGYFYDTTTANKHTIYALPVNPVSFYDISSWTKNATIFKKVTTPSFASLTSAGAIRTAGIANLASGTLSKITGLTAGSIILFKTAAGKYGAINTIYVGPASPAASTFINIDVKIEK